MSESSDFNEAEQEVIILKAILGLISDMVNHITLSIHSNGEESTLVPNNASEQRLFNILLVDFLSMPQGKGQLPFGLPRPPSSSYETNKTYLFYLQGACKQALLGDDPSQICNPVTDFSNWLETEITVENVWFPSINLNTNLYIRRIDFLKISGNISKHNFSRLGADVKKIRDIFIKSGHQVSEEQTYLVIDEFYERFHDDILNYHFGTIAEFLNNINLGIFEYLQPLYYKSINYIGCDGEYRYEIPSFIANPVAKIMFVNLMNIVRSGPIFQKFKVHQVMKLRY